MKKEHKFFAAAAGIAAVGLYRAIKGKGAFNGLRFKEQHDAVGKYVETHHKGAFYSAIEPTEHGWTCVITEPNAKYLLHISRSENGVYIFSEEKLNLDN